MSRVSSPLLFLCGVAIMWTGLRGATVWWMGDDARSAAMRTRSQSEDGGPARGYASHGLAIAPSPGFREPSVRAARWSARVPPRPPSPLAHVHIAGVRPFADPSIPAPAFPIKSAPVVVGAARDVGSDGPAEQPSPDPPAQPLREPAAGAPVGRAGSSDRWTLSTWAFARPDRAPSSLGQGLLGGSQVGVRAARRFGRAEAYVRAVSSGRLGDGIEGAAGLAVRPARSMPIALAAERRQQMTGDGGRSAFAAMATGGVSDVPLPLRLRLDGYGAVGIVGMQRRDLFVEGSAVARRPVVRLAGTEIEAGAGIWAAAQPGIARVDAGPSASALFPLNGIRARLSIDWRQRVAGDAAPQSGPAVTLAADF